MRAVVFDAVGTLIYPQPPAAVVYARIGRQLGSRRTVEEIGARFAAAFQHEESFDRQGDFRTSEERELLRWQRIVAAVLDDVSGSDRQACFHKLFEHFSLRVAHLQAAGHSQVDNPLCLGLPCGLDFSRGRIRFVPASAELKRNCLRGRERPRHMFALKVEYDVLAHPANGGDACVLESRSHLAGRRLQRLGLFAEPD